MADTQEKKAPEVSRLRADEMDNLLALYASLQEMETAKRVMEARLRSIPGGWRDISMIRSVLSRLIEQLMKTIPSDKLLSLSRNVKHMSYRVYLAHPVTKPREEVIVGGNDLHTLVEKAHAWNCTLCEQDCNKCELGQALDHVMIQCRGRRESWADIRIRDDWTDEKAGGKYE